MRLRLAAALAILLALGASAQQPAAPRIMLAFGSSGLEGEAGARDSLEAALAASPLAGAVLRYEAGADELATSARKTSCPISLSVEVEASAAGLVVSWSYAATRPESIELRSGSFEKPHPSARDLVSSFWTEVVEDLAPAITALPAEKSEAAPLPAQLLPSWTAEASLYGFSFPEARVSYLLGRHFFARLTLTQFFTGLNLQNYSGPPPEPSAVSSYSLLQAGAGFGAYFAKPDRNFRVYAAVDAFIRISMPGYSEFFVDLGAPVGVIPILGAEWGRETRSKLFLEFGGIFYPYANVEYLLTSRGQNGGTMVASGQWGFAGHPGWFLEFPLPRLGLRVYF